MNWELWAVQAGFRKGRGTRDQIANIGWIIEKAREFQKNIYFCLIDYTKAFDCVDYNKLWEIVEEMGIPDHLSCLLRNLYAGQETIVKTGHETTDWFHWERSTSRLYTVSLLVLCLVTQLCWTLCDHKDCSLSGSCVHGDSPRQEYWSGLPWPPPGNLLNPRTEHRSPALQADSLPSEPPGEPPCLFNL